MKISVLVGLFILVLFACKKADDEFVVTPANTSVIATKTDSLSTDSTQIIIITYSNGSIDSTITHITGLIENIITAADGQKNVIRNYADGSKYEFIEYTSGNYAVTTTAVDSTYKIDSYNATTKMVTSNCYSKVGVLVVCPKI